MYNRYLALPPYLGTFHPLQLNPNTSLPRWAQTTPFPNNDWQDVSHGRRPYRAHLWWGQFWTECESSLEDVF